MLKRIIIIMLALMMMVMNPIDYDCCYFAVDVEAAQKVELNKTKVTLRPGDTFVLSVIGTKNKASWGSSNEKVATVNQKGKVTAKKAGTVNIIALVAGKTYTCKVSVARTYTWTFNNHQYQLIEKGMKWSTAKKYCESIGGHLATVTSKNEQKALISALKKKGKRYNYWLGAKKNSAGNFKWITGEKFSYKDFASKMPDKDYEKCLMIYTHDNPKTSGDDSYKWNDLINDGTYQDEQWFGLRNFGFICEWD